METSAAGHVRIPHRQNRIVIFNSTLVHETDNFRFKAGYTNRRINLTFLFGERTQGRAPPESPAPADVVPGEFQLNSDGVPLVRRRRITRMDELDNAKAGRLVYL